MRRGFRRWLGFPRVMGSATGRVGVLNVVVEARIDPGGALPSESNQSGEIITYVCSGTLAYHDSAGRSGLVHAGEFQCAASGYVLQRDESNLSTSEEAHVIQVHLHAPAVTLESRVQTKRFSKAERRGGLSVVAAPDARGAALRVQRDALVYSALLSPGQRVVHDLPPGRTAWVQLVHGAMAYGALVLKAGDAAAVVGEPSLSLIALEQAELLLIDCGTDPFETEELP